MRTLAVLPSRFQASRFPGKPLVLIAGKPMIQWVFEAAGQAAGVDRVVVATDDDRIASAVRAFGGEAVMTDPALPSGTDR
ncbi:MAG TPA: NTP transferase domain-containing protein, partial [Geothrix sp.]|nr:NTP transferase domain-containing protein [Geothrix sp.]